MAAIDWSTTVAALDAALVSAVGVDLELGQGIRAELAALGAKYDGEFTSAADTAKTAWLAAAESAHDEADEAARFVIVPIFVAAHADDDPVPDPPAALTFDAYDSTAIVARCREAEKASTGFTLEAVQEHREAVEELFKLPNAATLQAFVPYWGGFVVTDLGGGATRYAPHVSVRKTELALVALIADATDWLALVAYS